MSETEQAVGLEPCPLAHEVVGGVGMAYRSEQRVVYIYCEDCGLQISDKTQRDVIAKWNSRVAPQGDAAFTAYNQAVQDALAAIRAESQGGGYWAATYINAIARKCSPHVYVASLPVTAPVSTGENDEWLPIDTAPKTGEEILLAHGNSVWADEWWDSLFWLQCGDDGSHAGEVPTHWRPMPLPPGSDSPELRTTKEAMLWAQRNNIPAVVPAASEPPHEHRWAGRGEYGGTEAGYMCADCGVDLDDTDAATPPPAITLTNEQATAAGCVYCHECSIRAAGDNPVYHQPPVCVGPPAVTEACGYCASPEHFSAIIELPDHEGRWHRSTGGGYYRCTAQSAPPSTSAAIRAAAEEIAQHVLNRSGVYEMSERYQTGLGDFTVEGYANDITAILSRWFGKGETDAAQQVRSTGDDKPGHPLIVRDHYHVDTLGHIAKRRCSCSLSAPPQRFVCAVCVESERHTTPAAPSPGEPRDTCMWTLDDSNDGEIWETSCGQAFSFTDGGVEDNGFVFCYKCGKRIDPGKYSDSVSVEGASE